MKPKILVCSALLAASLCFTPAAKADCLADSSSIANIASDLCWECMFPLYSAGFYIYKGNMPDVRGRAKGSSPFCMCEYPFFPWIRFGVPMGYWEANKMIDVVKDPYCFQGLGINSASNALSGIKLGGTKSQGHESGRVFMQSHYIIYPVTATMELFVDTLCLNWGSLIDIAYITEIDPMWQDDKLTAWIQPEAVLFGNPVSAMSCIADATAAQINYTLDPLFWCAGSWGNIYPLTGNTHNKDYVEDAASIAATMIYKLHRELVLWESSGLPTVVGICYDYPLPVWLKSSYRLQIISPMAHSTATGIGRSGILWDYAKNIPFEADDNFTFMVFKKKECCLL